MPTNPDLIRPLRTAPVRREEVLLHRKRWRLLTMPLGSYTCEERVWHNFGDKEYYRPYLVADPALWAAVLDEIAAEHAAAKARAAELQQRGFLYPRIPSLEISLVWKLDNAREYVCEHCGVGFLGPENVKGGLRYRVCSNRCERRHRAGRTPPPSKEAVQRIHANRTATRAAARAGRTCEHCGKAIEAARSTRRFCSDVCRVRSYRAKA